MVGHLGPRRIRLLVALPILLALGCSDGSDEPRRGIGDTASAASSSLPTPDPTTSSGATVADVCRVEMPDSWRARLPTEVVLDQTDLITSDGASAVFFMGQSPRLIWRSAKGDEKTVAVFEDQPQAQVMGSDFDGRYLAYAITWSFEVFKSPWTIYVWDSLNGGPPIEIATSPTREYPDGTSGTQPLITPVISGGHVAWVAFDPTSEDPFSRSIFSHDIEKAETTVLERGPLGDIHRYRNGALVSSREAGAATVGWVYASIDGGGLEALPEQVTQTRSPGWLGSGDAGIAWADGTDLWLWRSGDPEPSRLLSRRAPDGSTLRKMDAVALSDRFLTLRTTGDSGVPKAYVIDLTSMSATTLPDEGPDGEFQAYPGALKIWFYSDDKELGSARTAIIANDDLPLLPPCNS